MTLPHFIIGGAPRSGTTYLAQALAQHPRICMAQPFIPEPKVLMLPERTEGQYLAHYQQLFAHAGADQVRGEKTSYYLECAAARERIAALLPATKLLFIVREPVARAYSNYLWSRKNGLETLSFSDAIAAEGTRPDPLPDKPYAKPFDYLTRGNYAAFAEPYLRQFGPERIKFVLYEHLVLDADSLLNQVQDFLGVSRSAVSLDVGVVNSARDTGPALDPGLARELRQRMQPCVQRFGAITGLDLAVWEGDA